MKIYTYDPKKGHRIKAGELQDSHFIKTVSRKKHYLYIVSGYAIQEDVILQIKNKANTISIFEKDTGNTYLITMGDFLANSGIWTKEHGKQLTISEKYLTLENKGVKIS